MKQFIFQVCFLIMVNILGIYAGESCLFIQEFPTEKILVEEGPVDDRVSPCSTFKIVLSLIGYDQQILVNETSPVWKFHDEYISWNILDLPQWKADQTPTTWMKHSCVWFSQVLTKRLGMETFQRYIQLLHYGNEDLGGDKGKNNGLTQAWLSSSLKISPREQVHFIQKFMDHKLPFSDNAYRFTRNILFVEDLPAGYKLYAKTGSGSDRAGEGTNGISQPIGWFVGWVEPPKDKPGQILTFASLVRGQVDDAIPPRIVARNKATERIKSLLSDH